MNRVTLILTFLFSLMFSSPSYSEWTWASENVDGATYYVDYDRIRKVDGYVYWWDLTDYLKPSPYGDLSDKRYIQGDCKLFRIKALSDSFYKEPMGGGTPSTSSNKPDKEWTYPPPSSVGEALLKFVCEYAN